MTVTTLPKLKPSARIVALCHGIAAKQVRHYAWDKPQTIWKVDGLTEKYVTGDVKMLRRHGIAAIGADPEQVIVHQNALPVVLTDAGWAWLDRHGGTTKGPDQ
jgi:hypothetical protein